MRKNEPNKLTCSQLSGFKAQLVKHCTSIREVMGSNPVGAKFFRCLKKATIAEIVQISVRITFLFRLKIFLLETLQNEGWSTGVVGMDRVHEGVHGLGPQGWSMDQGSMFFIRPTEALYYT